MTSVTPKTRTLTNGTANDATPVEANFVELYNNDSTLATDLTTLQSGNTTITGNKTYSGTATFNGAVTLASTVSVSGTLNLGLSADPVSPPEGMAWGNTTSHLFKYYDGTITQTVAFLSNLGALPTGFRSGSHPTWTSVASVTVPSGYKCRDASDLANITVGSDLIVSLAASGALGLDTGAEASNTWYYLWLCSGASGVTAIFSASSSAPTLPTGYTSYKRRIPGAWRNDGSSNLIRGYFSGSMDKPLFRYEVFIKGLSSGSSAGPTQLVDNLSTATFTTLDCSGLMPPDSTIALLKLSASGNSGAAYIRRLGYTTDNGQEWEDTAASSQFETITYIDTDSTQKFEYKWAGTGTMSLALMGYQVTGAS